MTHEDIKEKLLALFDRELDERERKEIASHLNVCEDCSGTLKRWEQISAAMSRAGSASPSSGRFVYSVMERIAASEKSAPAKNPAPFLNWIFPTLGYTFAIFLMFIAITHREPSVNTDAVLLADVSQTSRWTFSAESPDLNKLVEVP